MLDRLLGCSTRTRCVARCCRVHGALRSGATTWVVRPWAKHMLPLAVADRPLLPLATADRPLLPLAASDRPLLPLPAQTRPPSPLVIKSLQDIGSLDDLGQQSTSVQDLDMHTMTTESGTGERCGLSDNDEKDTVRSDSARLSSSRPSCTKSKGGAQKRLERFLECNKAKAWRQVRS